MKFLTLSRPILALAAGALLAIPSSASAGRKVTIHRDLDGDGHYNKKTYHTGHHGSRYYGGHRGYYGRSYYGGYYNRPYYYGGYRPYYGSGYGYGYGYGPSIGLSYYSSPTYYSRSSTVYRGVPRESVSDSDNLAAEVQQALKRRGYYKGGIDGDIGPASRSAIRAYQADRGLSVTGRIDRSLLNALGIG
jgi:His-Xaa-Ser repeat protein HxsA